jgi:hypothetical protein
MLAFWALYNNMIVAKSEFMQCKGTTVCKTNRRQKTAFLILRKSRLMVCSEKIIYVFKLCLFQKWNGGRVRHGNYLQIFRRLPCGRGINNRDDFFVVVVLYGTVLRGRCRS